MNLFKIYLKSLKQHFFKQQSYSFAYPLHLHPNFDHHQIMLNKSYGSFGTLFQILSPSECQQFFEITHANPYHLVFSLGNQLFLILFQCPKVDQSNSNASIIYATNF